ncbi:hypothetical protein [Rhodobacter maris]|uniref:Uncharacterized protein n=1 Tax=Rhodobacter maris TaxID=446682 RepID=A0A285S6U6_9RHOB|nr:hypothetical protein [Rhodobacter maris]SOC03033.1 hypothetical protein SAMN05877831_103278 [Rhodobacter maris]
MPELVRLYIRNILFGALLSAAFVGMLLGFNVVNLRHLILTSDIGYIAIALLFVFNTVVFAGVQFGISVMALAEKEPPRGGGRRDAIPTFEMPLDMVAIPVPVDSKSKRKIVKKLY